MPKIPASLTLNKIMATLEDGDYVGFCLECGAQRDDCKPDAREYECTDCGAMQVYGAEEILLMIA